MRCDGQNTATKSQRTHFQREISLMGRLESLRAKDTGPVVITINCVTTVITINCVTTAIKTIWQPWSSNLETFSPCVYAFQKICSCCNFGPHKARL